MLETHVRYLTNRVQTIRRQGTGSSLHAMPRPPQQPIGLQLAQTAKAVSRAFDDALTSAGGSRPMWLILLALKRQRWETQAQLARSLGIAGPTLTHHLDALEQRGLVTRDRDPDNRRVHVVELTDAGDDMFHQLRDAATRHDRRIRRGLSGDDLDQLRHLLSRLHENVATGDDVPAGALEQG